MASDAKELVLGDLVSLTRGTTYQSALLGQPGPVLLGLASIQRNGGFRDDNLRTYGGDCPDKLTLRPGDIYVSLKDVTQAADLLGAVARVPSHVPAGRVTQDTVKLTFVRDDVSSRYVYWLLRTPAYREYCRAHAIGTTNLALPRADFLAFPVPRPKAREMLLVDVLDAIDEKIELNRRMNATLEAMTRALFQSWFVDFDPVRAKVDGRTTSLDAAATTLFPASFEDSAIGPVPLGWKVERFDAHMTADRGLSYKGDGLRDDASGLPMHNLNSIREGGGYKYEGIKYYAGEYRDKHLIEPGDMIVTNTEQGFDHLLIGHGAIVPSSYGARGIYSHHLYRVRPRPSSPLSPDYLVELFNNRRWHYWISGFSNGTTINMLPTDALEMPLLAVPPRELVGKFTALAKASREQIEGNVGQTHTLAALRDTLLTKLLSGGLRTSDATQQVAVVA